MCMNTEEHPNMKALLEIMRKEHIATKWYELGAELLENDNHLEVIKANHQNDVQSCCHEMFKRWLDVKPNASWSQLVTALRNIEMTTAAVAIIKQYETGIYIANRLLQILMNMMIDGYSYMEQLSNEVYSLIM